MSRREVDVAIKQHGRNWINFERPPYCPECNEKNIKHSISISRADNTKKYVAECMCLECGCEFHLVRIDKDDEE